MIRNSFHIFHNERENREKLGKSLNFLFHEFTTKSSLTVTVLKSQNSPSKWQYLDLINIHTIVYLGWNFHENQIVYYAFAAIYYTFAPVFYAFAPVYYAYVLHFYERTNEIKPWTWKLIDFCHDLEGQNKNSESPKFFLIDFINIQNSFVCKFFTTVYFLYFWYFLVFYRIFKIFLYYNSRITVMPSSYA